MDMFRVNPDIMKPAIDFDDEPEIYSVAEIHQRLDTIIAKQDEALEKLDTINEKQDKVIANQKSSTIVTIIGVSIAALTLIVAVITLALTGCNV